MCEFCGNRLGNKAMIVHRCANKTDITACELAKHKDDEKYGIVIFSFGCAKGYFDINFCPICGRKLSEDE